MHLGKGERFSLPQSAMQTAPSQREPQADRKNLPFGKGSAFVGIFDFQAQGEFTFRFPSHNTALGTSPADRSPLQ